MRPQGLGGETEGGVVSYDYSYAGGYCTVELASYHGRQQTYDLRCLNPSGVSKKLLRHNDEKISSCDLFWPYNERVVNLNAENPVSPKPFPNPQTLLLTVTHTGFIVIRVHALFTPFDGGLSGETFPPSQGGFVPSIEWSKIQDAAQSGIQYLLAVGASAAWNAITGLPGNHVFVDPKEQLKIQGDVKEVVDLLTEDDDATEPPVAVVSPVCDS